MKSFIGEFGKNSVRHLHLDLSLVVTCNAILKLEDS